MDTAAAVFCRATLYSDDALYILAHLPPQAITAAAGVLAEIGTPFSALIADKDEITLLLPQEYWDEFAGRLPDHRASGDYRLITFDLPLEPDLIGFLVLVSQILADAGVSILALSSFERDHILVSAAQFQTAWDALRAAQTGLASQ
ncbi:MAG: ACT domain-containing protein [Anaerolineae bacterium]|nr:ACT domain-containing protein [Anaerolineae bacterium]